MPALELTGGTLGIIGLGGFDLEIVKRAVGYDMTILAIDPVRQDKPLEVTELNRPSRQNLHSLLKRLDAVMIACPKVPETYHLIGGKELAIMKNTAYLVNVTRGGIVDEQALIVALKSGQIAGAGLDVAEVEPVPPNSPLWEAPNLIITPHTGGETRKYEENVIDILWENLARLWDNDPTLINQIV